MISCSSVEIISFSDDECYEIIKRCEETEAEPAMATVVVNHCESSEGTQETVCSACWRVISEDVYKYEPNCFARNVLTRSSVEINQTPGYANYWVTPVDERGSFVIDLGCSASYNQVQLVNTHNADLRDRTTAEFRVFLGDTPDPHGPDMVLRLVIKVEHPLKGECSINSVCIDSKKKGPKIVQKQ